MRKFFTKKLDAISALKKAGYDIANVDGMKDGFLLTVDMGLSIFDAPQWRQALTREVKSIIDRGKSYWA
jgi:hypothetical protein